MKRIGKPVFRGFKVQRINAVLMIIGCIFAGVVVNSSFKIKSKYNYVLSSMYDYADCTKAINEYIDATEYLSNQARLFVINNDVTYLKNYSNELTENRRRNLAVEILELSHLNDLPDVNMCFALSESDSRIEKELNSMKLICDAEEISPELIPSVIVDYKLPEEQKLLSKEKKLEYARELVFNADYVSSKERESKYTSTASLALVQDDISKQNENKKIVTKEITMQIIYTILLLVVCLGLYIFLVVLVLIPLFNNLAAIQKGIKMNIKGGFEIRYIAKAYNALCDKNEINTTTLKHKAEHDPLTGLINRNAFDQIKLVLENVQEPIAYLVIDIDFFKQINDQYGHPVGDEVLKKIAELLMDQFRTSDYVARVGGDEFAVIMTKFGTSVIDIIQHKIDGMNSKLQNLSDNLPKVSLSVGVAFSDTGYNDELVKKADLALYKVKKGGRCNCSFYNDNDENN